MYIVRYLERVYMARMHELASATSSEYFTIYTELITQLDKGLTFVRTIGVGHFFRDILLNNS